jgi:6-phosphofructokinase 1
MLTGAAGDVLRAAGGAMKKRRLAILTSGGDAPGMNAAIRAATMLALAEGWEVLGVSQGFRGLIEGRFAPLQPADVGPIVRRGGTILGSARCRAFLERDARDVARERLRDAGVEALLVIGGNGSLAGANALSDPREAGTDAVRVAAVPASIDNDIGFTGMSIGVDTAMNTIVEACDKISDTADAHDRTFLIEVMGRQCGYLAMTSAIASGADAVLFPEADKQEADVIETIVRTVRRVRARVGRTHRVVVVKAEGVPIPMDRLKTLVDERLRAEPDADPESSETRVTILGHVVRGGRPTAFDRLVASRLAHVAMRALVDGLDRKMAAWNPPVAPPSEVAVKSPFDPYCYLVELGAVLVETERLNQRTSPLVEWRKRVFDRLESVLSA